ncbi:MAG: site-2 protease family protein [Oscillospiraceae bacterium]|nr:site-2 protease family protein [Oscillospiraceae bacterium]
MFILFAILIFSFLIFIHELGHFAAAKLSGVQVNEFSLFMGPAIWKKQVGETLYAIRCIPVGGYCAMEGEDEETDNPRSFQKAAWWKRLIILVAGAAMNFVAGVLIFCIVFLPAQQKLVPQIQSFTDCTTINGPGGLQVGDEFLSIDGETIYVHSDVDTLLTVSARQVHDVVVLRDGQEITLKGALVPHSHTDENGETYSHYGFTYGATQKLDFVGKLDYVWRHTVDTVRNVRLSLQMIFTGQAGIQDMSGPVGIVSIMSDVASQAPSVLDAVMNILYFGGFLGINLAIMNLLPIPALDGGRVVGLLISTAYTAVTKKELDPKYEGIIHGVGMVLLLLLMGVIMFKDVFVLIMG